MEHFTTYFKALQSYNFAQITEHSLRPELKDLLASIASQGDDEIKILHEGKREGKFGAPDFKITRIDNIWLLRRLVEKMKRIKTALKEQMSMS